MPARRFFALMREGRKQTRERDAARDVAACDIASVALGDGKYYEEIRKVFFNRAMGSESSSSVKKSSAMDPTDPNTVELIESLTMAASKLRS